MASRTTKPTAAHAMVAGAVGQGAALGSQHPTRDRGGIAVAPERSLSPRRATVSGGKEPGAALTQRLKKGRGLELWSRLTRSVAVMTYATA